MVYMSVCDLWICSYNTLYMCVHINGYIKFVYVFCVVGGMCSLLYLYLCAYMCIGMFV